MIFSRFLPTRSVWITGLLLVLGTAAILPGSTTAVTPDLPCCCSKQEGISGVQCSRNVIYGNICSEFNKDYYNADQKCCENDVFKTSDERTKACNFDAAVFVEEPKDEQNKKRVFFTPQVGFPGTQFQSGVPNEVTGTTLGEWVAAAYAFFSGAIGILAAVMVLWGGFRWLTAAGNSSRVDAAKETIYSAIIALVLTLGAFVLLNTINPELVKIQDLTSLITPIVRLEQPTSGDYVEASHLSEQVAQDTEAKTTKEEFNDKPCPSPQELSEPVEVFLTGYYRPSRSDFSAGPVGDRSFQCQTALNCNCPKGKVDHTGNKCMGAIPPWDACQWTQEDIDNGLVCASTISGDPPVGLLDGSAGPFTAAAGECFGKGTRFKLLPIDGSRNATVQKVYNSEWTVLDQGGDIKRLHLDLFTGFGKKARNAAYGMNVRAKLQVIEACTSKTYGGRKNSKAKEAEIITCTKYGE